MNRKSYLFTSESVSEGHPDKVCDRISDMVVDTYLEKEPFSRVGCETLTTTNKVVLAGETRGPDIKKDHLMKKARTRDDYEDLQALIEYLLDHQKSLPTRFDLAGKKPSPLKKVSRLRGLLDQHYQEFLVDREKMKTSDNIKFVWAP